MLFRSSVGWKLYGERNKPLEQMTGKVDLPAHQASLLASPVLGNVESLL